MSASISAVTPMLPVPAQHSTGTTVPLAMAILQAALDLVLGQFLAVEVLHDEFVVALGGGLHQLEPELGRLVLERGGNFAQPRLWCRSRLHRHQIHHALKVGLAADGQLQRHKVGGKGLGQAVERGAKVGVLAIHLGDEDHARRLVFVGIAPRQLGAHFHAGHAVHE